MFLKRSLFFHPNKTQFALFATEAPLQISRSSQLRPVSPPHFVRKIHLRARDASSNSNWRSGQEFYFVEASSWTSVVAAAAALGGATACALFFARPSGASQEIGGREDLGVHASVGYFDMQTNTTPGHLGNLTAEQEAKLKEFWGATLRVFGVQPPPNAESSASEIVEEAAADGPTTNSISSEKDKQKSKRRFGVFKSKTKDKDGKDGASTKTNENGVPLPTSPSNPEDDKYGQTKVFHETLADSTPEELRATFWSMLKQDHPDVLLLRFLRARKWEVERALVMMVAAMRWRGKDYHVDDDIIANGEPTALEVSKSDDKSAAKEAEDFLRQMRMGKSFLHGCDKEGRPLCHVRVRLHKQGEQSETSIERYTVFTIETARYMLVPPVETACIIFDMTSFTLANMDYSPVKFMIKCFEANYPESLGVVLVHKAPWIFQGVWNIIKGWLDPVVASKIHFTRSLDDLETYIPRSNIIKELGGDDPFQYEYAEPDPATEKPLINTEADHAKRDALLHTRADTILQFQAKTYEWIASPSSSNDDLKKARNDLAESLRSGYWELDPFLRAKSYYDRSGIISSGGKVDFYPYRTKAKAEANGAAAAPTTTATEKEKEGTNADAAAGGGFEDDGGVD